MIAFLLIVGFPVVLAVGFGGLYLAADALGRKDTLDRAGLFLYPLLLTLPFAVALAVAWRQGTLPEIGLALPAIGGLSPAAALALAALVGIATGAGVFYGELAASRLIARLSQRSRGLRRALDGMSQDFARSQERTALAPALVLSLYIVFAEELLWRGFLLHFLTSAFSLPVAAAVLVAALAFGANHYYFGLRNVALKTLSGIVWAVLLLWTGSLLAPFFSHYTFECLVWRRLKR